MIQPTRRAGGPRGVLPTRLGTQHARAPHCCRGGRNHDSNKNPSGAGPMQASSAGSEHGILVSPEAPFLGVFEVIAETTP